MDGVGRVQGRLFAVVGRVLGRPRRSSTIGRRSSGSVTAARRGLDSAFIIIAFELTILFTGLSTLIAVLILGRLPQIKPSPTYDPRFSVDRFGVAVACPVEKAEAVGAMLSSAGAEEVRR